jgi:hypothetical protein
LQRRGAGEIPVGVGQYTCAIPADRRCRYVNNRASRDSVDPIGQIAEDAGLLAQGEIWLQALPSLPLGPTHNTFCAITGLADIDSTIAQTEVHKRMNFLMKTPLTDRRMQIRPTASAWCW